MTRTEQRALENLVSEVNRLHQEELEEGVHDIDQHDRGCATCQAIRQGAYLLGKMPKECQPPPLGPVYPAPEDQ